jgi:hypothetical protein
MVGVDAVLSATVATVINVDSIFNATFSGELDISIGTGELINAADWLIALPKVTSPGVEGHIVDYFTATASFNGTVGAHVSAAPPFSGLEVSASGVLSPFILDLANLNETRTQRPTFDLMINLPDIGDVKNLRFSDVVDLLDLALEFLIGEGSVESCSDGLLGTKIGDERVFLATIPGMYNAVPVLGCCILSQDGSTIDLIIVLSSFFILFLAIFEFSLVFHNSHWNKCM